MTVSEARYHLLFGEFEQLSGFDKVSTLHSRSCGEGPAGAAACLVLDSVDCVLCTPVDSATVAFLLLEDRRFDVLQATEVSVPEKALLLGLSPCGQEVVTGEVGHGGVRIDLVDLLVKDGVEVHTEVEFFHGAIAETLLSNMLHEVLRKHI